MHGQSGTAISATLILYPVQAPDKLIHEYNSFIEQGGDGTCNDIIPYILQAEN